WVSFLDEPLVDLAVDHGADVALVAFAVLPAALARLAADDGQRKRRGLLPIGPDLGCQAHRRSAEERLSQELPPRNCIAHDRPPEVRFQNASQAPRCRGEQREQGGGEEQTLPRPQRSAVPLSPLARRLPQRFQHEIDILDIGGWAGEGGFRSVDERSL